MKKKSGITADLRNRWIENWTNENDSSDNYIPFITTQDIKSAGSKARTPDHEVGQGRDLLSTNERLFLYRLRFSEKYVSIKEQYPLLPLDRAIAISKQMGLRYPTYPSSPNVKAVMTSDFFCKTVTGEEVVYSIKDEAEYLSMTSRKQKNLEEKLNIERNFWQSKDVKWHLIMSTNIKTTFASNLGILFRFNSISLPLMILHKQWISCLASAMKTNEPWSLAKLVSAAAEQISISYDEAIEIFQYCLWHKKIIIDLNKDLVYEKPFLDFNIRISKND